MQGSIQHPARVLAQDGSKPGWDCRCLPSAQGEPRCPGPEAAGVAVPHGSHEEEELPFMGERSHL